ncbi:MAG: HD domain-containing protein [Spirochaetia bacterium]|nr:HD domain-containing protein [Spirochaetia bacterium]
MLNKTQYAASDGSRGEYRRNSTFCSSLALPSMGEFNYLTNDILHHREFVKLKDYFHHTHHIYDHVVRVAYLSYFFSKLLGLDYISTARGGLLHDFFLYDWRVRKKGDEHRSLHGKEHPYIALSNANLYFDVNEKETDIITKHMYPKTKERPIYAESFIVSIMDKVSTLIEYGKRIIFKKYTSYKKSQCLS